MVRTFRSLPIALALLVLMAVDARALTWSCSTVAQQGAADPSSGVFKTRFGDPAINGSGDVTFHAKVRNGGRRLFLYPAAGAPLTIASQGDPSPDSGGDFRKFGSPSINDAGDVGFFADIDAGDGAFVREAGGTIVRAAGTGDPSPSGGTFARIDAVSRVNADGDLAFMARVDGGADGVFFFDKSLDTVSTVAAVGDGTGDARFFCDFIKGRTVDLSDLGHASFQAKTAPNCAAGTTTGFWLQTGGGFANVADVGAVTPLAGTSYNKMLGQPLANASDKVLFRAKVRPADTCDNITGDLCTLDSDCEGICIGGTNANELCTTIADCPDQTAVITKCTTPECGGNRCLGGANIGVSCSSDSDCGGSSCDVPGQSGKALFLYDPVGPATSTVVAERDPAPNTGGGTLKTLAPAGGLSDGDQAAFRSKVRSGTAKHGAFIFNGTDEDIVLASEAVPTDAFGVGSRYRKIVEQTGLSRSGTWFTYSARVRDFSGVPSSAGLFRCNGL